MKVTKPLIAITFLMAATTSAHAATYTYTDLGLNYSINTDNPLITKASFDATTLNASQRTDFSVTPIASASVTVNAFTLSIPAIGPSGLQISPDGKAVPVPKTQPQVQAQISGTYTEDWNFNGTSGSHSGSWSQLVTFNLNLPTIDLWDFPASAPLLTGYSANTNSFISLFDEQHNVSIGLWSGILTLKLGISGINVDQDGKTKLSIYHYPTLTPVTTPIPSSIFLFGTGLAGLIVNVARRRIS